MNMTFWKTFWASLLASIAAVIMIFGVFALIVGSIVAVIEPPQQTIKENTVLHMKLEGRVQLDIHAPALDQGSGLHLAGALFSIQH